MIIRGSLTVKKLPGVEKKVKKKKLTQGEKWN